MKLKSKYERDGCLEDAVATSDDDDTNEVPRVESILSSRNEKAESRSSSGIGTASHQSSLWRDGSDDMPSMGFSPAGKDESFQGTSRDYTKKKVPGKIYKTEKEYQMPRMIKIQEKYDDRVLEENDDADFVSLKGMNSSDSESNFDETERLFAATHTRVDKLEGSRRNVSRYDVESTSKGKPKETSKKEKKRIKTDKESKKKNLPDSEDESFQQKDLERKFSNHFGEMSDQSSMEEVFSDKPAKQALKKTFIGMLSKIQLNSTQADTGSVSEIGSDRSRLRNRNKEVNANKSGKKLTLYKS